MRNAIATFLIVVFLGLPRCGQSADAPSLVLSPSVQTDSEGVFLNQVAGQSSGAPLPAVRLAAAPAFSQSMTLTRGQISQLIAQMAPALATTNLTGAATVRVTRRARTFSESDLLELLTTTLQQNYVKERGTLELRLTRPWSPISVPDESLTLKVLDLPTMGVTAAFIVRFELRVADESVGTWQTAVQARIWRDVWVASSTLRRGDPLSADDLSRERRDVLTLRDVLTELPEGQYAYEIAETVLAGMPLTPRCLKLKPVVHRGQSAQAVVQDGALSVTMKVEVLEDGAPGQIVRVRNLQSRREIRGKVINEQTILVEI